MKFVIFGLTMSSSWGNGHATLWRGLCKALARRGHSVVFFERDVPYYAAHRDYNGINGVRLCLYPDWPSILPHARGRLAGADVAMVTSYCPDGPDASELVLSSSAGVKVFYDLDTPVTLDRLRSGESVPYLSLRGLRDFDLVLSYTGGEALHELQTRLGAMRVFPLYGSVDPEVHRPVRASSAFKADMSYLGTYSADRQELLEELFLEPARMLPGKRFLVGGSLYPQDFPWAENIYYSRHVPPPRHPEFYCSSGVTLNITRKPMADMGYCPSGRLFEAAACMTPIVSDFWEGLDNFFEPGDEILICRSSGDVLDVLNTPGDRLRKVARAARERVFAGHTAEHRAIELEEALEEASGPQSGGYKSLAPARQG